MRSVDRTGVRQRTFTEDARRAQIIGCAIGVLADVGYAQTSFARVAEQAGISKSVISYHFGSKDDLLEQVVESVYTEGARYIAARPSADRSAPAVLAAFLRSNLDFLNEHPREIAALTEIVVNVRRREGGLRFVGGLAAVKPWQELLERGQAEGDFADFDTRTMAWAIRNMIDAVPRQRNRDPDFDFEVCRDELIALVDRATRRTG